MTPYPSEQFEDLMTAYVLGDLDATDSEAFAKMLEDQPELQAEVSKMQAAFALLPYALPEVEPPAHLRSQILTAAQEPALMSRASSRFSWSWSQVLAGVAVLVALILGFETYRTHQALNRSRTLAARQAEILAVFQDPQARWVTLKGVDTSPASGQIVFDRSEQKLVLALRQLAPLPNNQIYRLWAVIDDQKIACGDFYAQKSKVVLDSLSIPQAACTSSRATLVVTQEPYPSPSQPVGTAVLISQ